MRLNRVHALFGKELREALRSARFPLLMCLVMPIMSQWWTLRRLSSLAAARGFTSLESAALASLVGVAPLVIPYCGMILIQGRLAREQMLGALASLLCGGICFGDIWLAKVLCSFVVGYVCTIVAMCVNVLIISVYLNTFVALSPGLAVLLLVLSPLIAMVLLIVMSLCALVVRIPIIMGVLSTSLLVLMQSQWHRLVVRPDLLSSAIGLAALAAAIALWLSRLAVNQLSRQYLLKL